MQLLRLSRLIAAKKTNLETREMSLTQAPSFFQINFERVTDKPVVGGPQSIQPQALPFLYFRPIGPIRNVTTDNSCIQFFYPDVDYISVRVQTRRSKAIKHLHIERRQRCTHRHPPPIRTRSNASLSSSTRGSLCGKLILYRRKCDRASVSTCCKTLIVQVLTLCVRVLCACLSRISAPH